MHGRKQDDPLSGTRDLLLFQLRPAQQCSSRRVKLSWPDCLAEQRGIRIAAIIKCLVVACWAFASNCLNSNILNHELSTGWNGRWIGDCCFSCLYTPDVVLGSLEHITTELIVCRN